MGINDTKFDIVERKVKFLRLRINSLLIYSLIWIIINISLIFLIIFTKGQYADAQIAFLKSNTQLNQETLSKTKISLISVSVLFAFLNIIFFLIKVLWTNFAINKNKELEEHYKMNLSKLNKVMSIGRFVPFLSFIAYGKILKKASDLWVELQSALVNKKDEINLGDGVKETSKSIKKKHKKSKNKDKHKDDKAIVSVEQPS
ncbi:hypothetical protein [Mycoplasma bradburyae]|uniref:hypothetical protein n=1 Tax=Mycoplasma bradburyae TaxID=2963128 RepID=UPI00234220FA|nr:hypothetical protein [Mycoplasma bradburyae]MDC4184376.1 hypothetical protein [Mycoplasma bradburyae]